MSKILLFSIAGVATAAAATTYYISPAIVSDLDVSPISVAAPSEEVKRRMRAASIENFAAAWGASNDLAELRSRPDLVDPRLVWSSDDEMEFTLSLTNERVLKLTAQIVPVGSVETFVDVQAELLDNAFSQNDRLQPYDLKVMAMVADSVATEYLDSLLKERRMASSRELEERIAVLSGFDRDQGHAFADRVKLAFAETYGKRFETALAMDPRGGMDGIGSESGFGSGSHSDWANDEASSDPAAPASDEDWDDQNANDWGR